MNRRIRPAAASSRSSDDRFHRFLKPGALARLRDSRIIARAPRSVQAPRLSPPSSPSPSPTVPPQIDGSPCFTARTHGPRFLQRKKLAAAKFVLFSSPGSAATDGPDSLLDSLGTDLVAAH